MNSLRVPLLAGLVCVAVVLGVGLITTNFPEYLGSDPATCNNCHVMDGQYEGWFHGPHHVRATCIDCHTPHAVVPKYLYKGLSGMNHVLMFTLNEIPEPLRAKENTKEIVQANCIRCHQETVSEIADGQMDASRNGGRHCSTCHRTVAHGPRGATIYPIQDKSAYPIDPTIKEE